MLKLLIVDDEKIIRDGLSKAIDWGLYDIEVCAVKSGGQEALDFCETEMPDIIITDIKMSKMSGLDFIEKLGDRRKNCKIIILSGFDDFKFSKRALQNNVFEYLLKPVKPQVVIDAVVRASALLLEERKEHSDREQYMKYLKKNINAVRSQYFSELICNSKYVEEEAEEMMSVLGLDFSEEDKFFVMSVALFGAENTAYYAFFSDFQNDDVLHVFFAFNGGYGIFGRASEDKEKLVMDVSERIKSICNCEVSIGVSKEFTGIKNLKKGWEEATLALNCRDITGGSQIIYYNDKDNAAKRLEINEEKLDDEIVDAIDRLDKNAFKTLFNDFLNENPDIPIKRFQRSICKAILSTCGYIIKIDENPDKVIGDWNVLSEKINSFDDFDVLVEFCIYIFQGVIDKIIDCKCINSSPVINKIVEYLDENYAKPFSLETIAQNVYLSPNYVSTLFKRETGKRLSDYVVEVRVEKAKELLKNTNLRAYEIADKVGYLDSRYFGDLFKKITGLSLTEYRKSLQ